LQDKQIAVSTPDQGIMEEVAGAEGEEDADVEVVVVQGDKEVVPHLQIICVIRRGQEDVVAWHLALDICLPQVISPDKQPSCPTPHIPTL
jgi:hypothetical protein